MSSISSLSGVSAIAGFQPSPESWRKEFRQLAQALSAGNLADAQTAYGALTQGSSNLPKLLTDQNNPLAQDFNAIGQALQSGDLNGAQQAFAKLQQDLQSFRQSVQGPATHGHHGRHGATRSNDGDADDGAAPAATSGSTSGSTTSSTSGSTGGSTTSSTTGDSTDASAPGSGLSVLA